MAAAHAEHGAPMLAIGPGTGLGVAAYVPPAGTGRALMSEGAHYDAARAVRRARTPSSRHCGKAWATSPPSASCRAGPGKALTAPSQHSDGATVPDGPAREITKATGIEGSCAVSRAALDTFCAMLGEVAWQFCALVLGARGVGVFIGRRLRAAYARLPSRNAAARALRRQGPHERLCAGNSWSI